MKLWHCQGWRLATTCWLRPQQAGYRYTCLMILDACPVCAQVAMQFFHVETTGQATAPRTIEMEDPSRVQAWKTILREDFLGCQSPFEKPRFRETRFQMFVSQYTHKISRGKFLTGDVLS